MNHYFKLLSFELKRSSKLYYILLGITFLSQFIGVIVSSKGYVNRANKSMFEEGLSKTEYIEQFGLMSFSQIIDTLLYSGPITLCAASLVIYLFVIWYRDWYGKNTFVYRLLMLPSSRMNVFFAKASAIFLMVIGLISFELILLPFQNSLFKMLVPGDFRIDANIREILLSNQVMNFIIPTSFSMFLISYGIGIMAVLIIFTAILFERSYRLKGILMGVLFCFISVVIFLAPLLVLALSHMENILYPLEYISLQTLLGIIVISLSIKVSSFLINKRITV